LFVHNFKIKFKFDVDILLWHNMNNMDASIEENIRVENELIKEYVKAYPYPEFKEISNILQENICKNIVFLDMCAEYGLSNHICCKRIYENPIDKELIIEMGKKIFERGGIQALTMNHNVIKYVLSYRQSTNIIIRGQGSIIDHYFQEVCEEWKA